MRLRNQRTGEHVLVDLHKDKSITAAGEGAHLLKTDLFAITRRVLDGDASHYDLVGDVDIMGPVPA